jgi:hypothetical protein
MSSLTETCSEVAVSAATGERAPLAPFAERLRRASGKEGELDLAEELTLAQGLSVRVAEELASNPATSLEASRVLAEHPSEWVRKALARATPHLEVRLLLLDSPDLMVALAAFTDARDPEVLERTSTHRDRRLRLALAQRRSIPAGLECLLALDPSTDVRSALAANEGLRSCGAMLLLAQDSSERVRTMLSARQRTMPLSVMHILSTTPDQWLRTRLANGPLREFDARFDVEFLLLSPSGTRLVEEALAPFDPVLRDELLPSWTGTLKELVDALTDLGPDQPA